MFVRFCCSAFAAPRYAELGRTRDDVIAEATKQYEPSLKAAQVRQTWCRG